VEKGEPIIDPCPNGVELEWDARWGWAVRIFDPQISGHGELLPVPRRNQHHITKVRRNDDPEENDHGFLALSPRHKTE